MFARLCLVFTIVMVAVSAAYACKCIEFKDTTAVMASPTMGAAYVTLVSDKNDTLTHLTSSCCEAVELHETTKMDGVMRMRKLDSLALTSGVAVDITGEQGTGDAMHLMLIGIKKPLKPGQKFNVTFHFAKEGPHSASFTVVKRGQKPGAATADHSMHEGMDMSAHQH